MKLINKAKKIGSIIKTARILYVGMIKRYAFLLFDFIVVCGAFILFINNFQGLYLFTYLAGTGTA